MTITKRALTKKRKDFSYLFYVIKANYFLGMQQVSWMKMKRIFIF